MRARRVGWRPGKEMPEEKLREKGKKESQVFTSVDGQPPAKVRSHRSSRRFVTFPQEVDRAFPVDFPLVTFVSEVKKHSSRLGPCLPNPVGFSRSGIDRKACDING